MVELNWWQSYWNMGRQLKAWFITPEKNGWNQWLSCYGKMWVSLLGSFWRVTVYFITIFLKNQINVVILKLFVFKDDNFLNFLKSCAVFLREFFTMLYTTHFQSLIISTYCLLVIQICFSYSTECQGKSAHILPNEHGWQNND